MTLPDISVVIPSHRREARLAFALDALARQTTDPTRFEVLVVRARGEHGPRTTPPDGLTVRFLESAERGPAAQRNTGWRSARAPVVAFTDDDCRSAPDWIAGLLDAAAGEAIVQGRTEPDPDEAHLLVGVARSMEVTAADPWHPSCNIAYPTAVLEALGGFDEAYLAPYGEDTDLGLRALASGTPIVYADDAIVWHAVHTRTLPAALREARRAEWVPLVLSRHPEQRRALYRHLFLYDSHATLLVGLVGAALFRHHRRLAAAAFAPYLLHHLRHARGGPAPTPLGTVRLALEVLQRLVVDTAELTASIRGSIRHRSIVL